MYGLLSMNTYETDPSIVFVHSGWRTGGTALAFSLRESSDVRMYYDPFNEHVAAGNFDISSDQQKFLRHPPGAYFEEFRLIRSGRGAIKGIRATDLPFEFEDHQTFPEVRSYLETLIAEARSPVVVMKLEDAAGKISWLKSTFPNSLHIGLVRERTAQFDSWLEQLAIYDNPFFFEKALTFIKTNPELFLPVFDPNVSLDCLESLASVFDCYQETYSRLLTACDLFFDVSPETSESVIGQVSRLEKVRDDRLRVIFEEALKRVATGRPTSDRRAGLHEVAIRYLARNKLINQDREVLDQQLNLANQDREQLSNQLALVQKKVLKLERAVGAQEAQISALLTSNSWKVTAPLRRARSWFRLR